MNDPAIQNLLLLLATFILAGVLIGCSYVGFLYGRESGMCAVRCANATNSLGKDRYYGGRCSCLLDGKDVSP